jgi:hypothetical protein
MRKGALADKIELENGMTLNETVDKSASTLGKQPDHHVRRLLSSSCHSDCLTTYSSSSIWLVRLETSVPGLSDPRSLW